MVGKNQHAGFSEGLSSPANDWFDVTPSDGTELAQIPRALFIGAGGDLVLTDAGGNDSTFKVLSGQLLPVRPTFVKATGTTATDIIGIF